VIDRDLRAKHDNEAILGIDREVAANFAVGAAFTYRRSTDWDYRPLLAGPCTGELSRQSCAIIGPEQYAPNTAITTGGLTAQTLSPSAALVTAGGGGR